MWLLVLLIGVGFGWCLVAALNRRYHATDYIRHRWRYTGKNLTRYDVLPAVRDDVVISLTTTPDRIHTIHRTVESLLRQTVRCRIELNIPPVFERTGEPYVVPANLCSLKRLRVCRDAQDVGPATKVIPTVQRYGDTSKMIVFVDDDRTYDPQLVAVLLAERQKHPNAVIAAVGSSWYKRKDGIFHGERVTQDMDADVLMGYGGVLVNSQDFPPAIRHGQIPELPDACRRMDDVWLSALLRSNGKTIRTASVYVPNSSIEMFVESVVEADTTNSRARMEASCGGFCQETWHVWPGPTFAPPT